MIGPFGQGYGFSSGHVQMWELDCEESWAPKNWCFWTVVLEKTLERPLEYKEIRPVHPKGDQSWVFIGRTDVEAETPILWPPDVKSWLRKRSRCWERLGAGGERDDRGWDGWMVSPTRCSWVWVDFGSWWWTGRPGVLWFMGLQTEATELTDWYHFLTLWKWKSEKASQIIHIENKMQTHFIPYLATANFKRFHLTLQLNLYEIKYLTIFNHNLCCCNTVIKQDWSRYQFWGSLAVKIHICFLSTWLCWLAHSNRWPK